GSGIGENIRRLMHHKNAAKVLPLPVGARMRVESPFAMAGQPAACAAVAPANTASNHSRTAGWNSANGLAAGGGAASVLGRFGISLRIPRSGTITMWYLDVRATN